VGIGHLVGIFYQFIKPCAVADRVVAAKDFGIQLFHRDVKPAVILGFFFKKRGVVFNGRVNGLVKGEATVCFIEWLVGFFGINDARVRTGLWHSGVFFATKKEKEEENG
jgi:hypothetical protein